MVIAPDTGQQESDEDKGFVPGRPKKR